MHKLPQFDCCLYCAHDYNLVCALHPFGVEGNDCRDFSLAPKRESKRYEGFLGLLAPVGSDEEPAEDLWHINKELMIDRSGSFYNGEEIVHPHQRWRREEMLALLDEHPIFPNRCPSCEMPFPRFEKPPVHWDCSSCGWKDDSI